MIAPPPPAIVRPAPVPAALARARAYWHAAPACRVRVVNIAQLPEGATAEAIAEPEVCTIALDARYWGGARGEAWVSWTEFCQTITHELGHLLGHGHSSDPRSIMFPVLSERNVPAVCGHAALWPGGDETGWRSPAPAAADWLGAGVEVSAP